MDYLGICFIGRSPEGGGGSGSIPGSSSKIAWPRFVKGLQDGEILSGSCPRVPRVGDCKVKGAFHFLMAAILGVKQSVQQQANRMQNRLLCSCQKDPSMLQYLGPKTATPPVNLFNMTQKLIEFGFSKEWESSGQLLTAAFSFGGGVWASNPSSKRTTRNPFSYEGPAGAQSLTRLAGQRQL